MVIRDKNVEIDIENETIIPLTKVGKHWPGPRCPSRATVFRYALDGLKIEGSDQREKLASVKLNGIRCTSVEAIARFLRAVNGQSAVPTITPSQRRQQAETANHLLQQAGY